MTESTFIITDLESLHQWRAEILRGFAPSVAPPVRFNLPASLPFSNQRLDHQAARLRDACGCTAGSLGLAVGVIGSGVALALDPRGIAGMPWLSWVGYVLLIAGAAAFGKVAGLFWARRRLLSLAGSVERMIIGRGGRHPPP